MSRGSGTFTTQIGAEPELLGVVAMDLDRRAFVEAGVWNAAWTDGYERGEDRVPGGSRSVRGMR